MTYRTKNALKLNVEALLNPDLHLDRVVDLREVKLVVHPQLLLLHLIPVIPRDRHPEHVTQPRVDPMVRFVLKK